MLAEERFWRLVDKMGDGCWEWRGHRQTNGYGRFKERKGKVPLVHRFAYALANGPIPEGLQIDHLCRNRGCVNPAHLEAVTRKVNILRGIGETAKNARKTHCKSGHELSPANLMRGGQTRYRRCKTCAKRWREESRQRLAIPRPPLAGPA